MTETAEKTALQEYDALKNGTGLVRGDTWLPFSASGPDAVDYLTRRLSRSIKELRDNEGTQSFQLSGDGKVLAEMLAYRMGERITLLCPAESVAEYAELTERYVLMDEVDIARDWEARTSFALIGPGAIDMIVRLTGDEDLAHVFSPFGWVGYVSKSLAGVPLTIYRDGRWPLPYFHVNIPTGKLSAFDEELAHCDCVEIGKTAHEFLRCESGVVRPGRDLDDTTNPLEAGQWDGVAFERGCYPGQEALARIRNLGHPPRVFMRFEIEGEHTIGAGAVVALDGDDAGVITSIATLPGGGKTIALGLVKWRFRETDSAAIRSGDRVYEAKCEMIVQRNAEFEKFWNRINTDGDIG